MPPDFFEFLDKIITCKSTGVKKPPFSSAKEGFSSLNMVDGGGGSVVVVSMEYGKVSGVDIWFRRGLKMHPPFPDL